MNTHHYDDAALDRWRSDPAWRALQFEESNDSEQAPPLWKDVTLAAVMALGLWIAAAAVIR